MMVTRSIGRVAVLVTISAVLCHSFQMPCSTRSRCFSTEVLRRASRTSSADTFQVKKVESMDDIMEVASFRNDLTSPEMMIKKQQEKKDAIDTTSDGIKGVAIGFAIGIGAGAFELSRGGSFEGALTQFAVIGGTVASILGYNGFTGGAVYVMDIDQARNRLKVDFVEGLTANFDVCHAAYMENNFLGGRYTLCGGICGTVDSQLRNSPAAVTPTTYGELPPHVHIKNLEVDRMMRRKGVARELVKEVEEYAKAETDAKFVSLIVDDFNTAAINLYKSAGYSGESIGTPAAEKKYGQWFKGRSFLKKDL